jgi:hypothetical protein
LPAEYRAPDRLAANDRAAFAALAEVALEHGGSGFVVLDLVTVIATGESRLGA